MRIDKKVRELYPDSAIDYDEMADDIFNQIQDDDYQEPVFDQSKDFVEPETGSLEDIPQYKSTEYLGPDRTDYEYRKVKHDVYDMNESDFLPVDYTEVDTFENNNLEGSFNPVTNEIQVRKDLPHKKKMMTLVHENFHKLRGEKTKRVFGTGTNDRQAKIFIPYTYSNDLGGGLVDRKEKNQYPYIITEQSDLVPKGIQNQEFFPDNVKNKKTKPFENMFGAPNVAHPYPDYKLNEEIETLQFERDPKRVISGNSSMDRRIGRKIFW